jgi:hypothetical protein
MEKKIIFLELPTNVIEKIDEQNSVGSRSMFISELLEKQLQMNVSKLQASPEIPTTMHAGEPHDVPGELSLINSKGVPLGRFNINTVEGFERLAEKICELSDDPIVRMKTRRWR